MLRSSKFIASLEVLNLSNTSGFENGDVTISLVAEDAFIHDDP